MCADELEQATALSRGGARNVVKIRISASVVRGTLVKPPCGAVRAAILVLGRTLSFDGDVGAPATVVLHSVHVWRHCMENMTSDVGVLRLRFLTLDAVGRSKSS